MQQVSKTTKVLAATAMAIAISGAPLLMPAAAAGKVKCMGINSCKGMSDCATKMSSCKGMNACKGHGFKFMKSVEACKAAGGKAM